jgi:hypothetical protein
VEKLKAQEEGIKEECMEEFILRSVPPPISKGQQVILHVLVRLECKNLDRSKDPVGLKNSSE